MRLRGGIVSAFPPGGRFAFIRPVGGGADWFTHISEFDPAELDMMQPGTQVTFDVGHHHGRSVAVNVRLAIEPSEQRSFDPVGEAWRAPNGNSPSAASGSAASTHNQKGDRSCPS
jgi:cold shock CspA family protein